MKKIISFALMCVLLLSPLMGAVSAADDVPGLSYEIKLKVTNKDGKEQTTFAIGEKITVKVSAKNIGGGVAPIYGVQGDILFDKVVVQGEKADATNGFSATLKPGRGHIVYLDSSGKGSNEAVLNNLGVFTFSARTNGKCAFTAKDFIITNKDATTRQVDQSEQVEITVGTGIKDVTTAVLQADIDGAQALLGKTFVTDEPDPAIFEPETWVTTATRDAFQAVIDAAKAVLNKQPVATTAEIEKAVSSLSDATTIFLQSRFLGRQRWSGMVTINAKAEGHGKIHPDFVSVTCKENTSCTITAVPDAGYETEYVFVNGVRYLGSNTFTIPRVTNSTNVVFTFCKTPPFTDAVQGDWFYHAVRYTYNHDIFKGVSETKFNPGQNVSRATIATLIYRIAGSPAVKSEMPFLDVPQGQWYTDAIAWAAENGVVKGYSENKFLPDVFMTREQCASLLYRYASSKGALPEPKGTLEKYLDGDKVSEYAKPAMLWANETGLIQGKTAAKLDPLGKTTRAEIATILMRFDELMKK